MSTKFIRLREVLALTGLKESTMYALAKAGRFPSPVKLGARASAWVQAEVDTWMETRVRESRRVSP